MGTSYSLGEQEKITWNYHCLLFDEDNRIINLDLIDIYFPNDSEIQLAKQSECRGGLNYEHYFITDAKGVHFLELSSLGGNSEEVYDTSRVQCNTLPHVKYEMCGKAEKITLEIKERMIQMLGMCNYSLCLRNSEHVANYIFNGLWTSFQMEHGGDLFYYFENKLTKDQCKKINIFPSTIAPKTVGGSGSAKLYSMIDKQYTPTSFQYYSDGNKESYNILVVGPTGAGKSHLINVLFNTDICDSKVSHKSVTREVCFIEGNGEIIDVKTGKKDTKKIVVADTVGLCDTEWDDDKIFQLLKGRVSRNFSAINAVFIVFRADRLLKDHVKNIAEVMKWLDYNKRSNYLNFLFVGMFAENLSQKEKEVLKEEAREIFELKDTKIPDSDYESLVYVGFPPEDQMNDKGKDQIIASWELLQPLMRLNDSGRQIKSYQKHVAKVKTRFLGYIPLPKLTEKCTIL